jgi:hypothetical protein
MGLSVVVIVPVSHVKVIGGDAKRTAADYTTLDLV